MNSNNRNSSNDQFPNNCGDWIKNFFTRVPIFVRTVILTTLLLYLANYYTSSVEQYLGNCPRKTVNSLYLWTLLTSFLINPNLLNLIFAYISWIPDGIRLESSNGTVKYILNFFINNVVIQFFFIVISYVLSFISADFIEAKSMGLWPAIMAEITMLCIASPENYVNLCLIPFEFRAKFYPAAIYLFLVLANEFRVIFLDVLIGIGFGYLYFFHLKHFLNVGDSLVVRVERLLSFMAKLTGRFPFKFLGFVPFQNNSNTGSFGYLQSRQGNDLNSSNPEHYHDGSVINSEAGKEAKIEVKTGKKNNLEDKNNESVDSHEDDTEHNSKKHIPGESLDE